MGSRAVTDERHPVLTRLSSQAGDRTEASNRAVAARCLERPELLAQIVAGLSAPDAALAGDCAEVLTLVAAERSDLVAPHIAHLRPLLSHHATRVRWETAHALALAGAFDPTELVPLVPSLAGIVRHDASRITRDWAIATLAVAARADVATAQQVTPMVLDALTLWDSKHTAQALAALRVLASAGHGPDDALAGVALRYAEHVKPSVRKAARALLRTSQGREDGRGGAAG
jgi:hypothetical protein